MNEQITAESPNDPREKALVQSANTAHKQMINAQKMLREKRNNWERACFEVQQHRDRMKAATEVKRRNL